MTLEEIDKYLRSVKNRVRPMGRAYQAVQVALRLREMLRERDRLLENARRACANTGTSFE